MDTEEVVESPLVRECGTCTQCCEGWLNTTVFGNEMKNGQGCPYVCPTGCGVYDKRPYDPCQGFKCAYLMDEAFPLWMRPDISNLICYSHEINGITYYRAVETNATLSARVLNFITRYAIDYELNMLYEFERKLHLIGTPEFIAAMTEEDE
jgi:hypothetical protein